MEGKMVLTLTLEGKEILLLNHIVCDFLNCCENRFGSSEEHKLATKIRKETDLSLDNDEE